MVKDEHELRRSEAVRSHCTLMSLQQNGSILFSLKVSGLSSLRYLTAPAASGTGSIS